MDKSIMKILCEGCPKLNCKIELSGSMNGVDYISFSSNKKYIIVDNPDVSWNDIMKERDNFVSMYVPKFGKFEIEAFIGYKMMEALFITKDITNLLNSELLCDDSPYNVLKITSEMLQNKLLKCFEIIDEEMRYNKEVIKLMFKWKPYYEMEE